MLPQIMKGEFPMNEQELKKYLDDFKAELIELIEQQLKMPKKQLLTIREAAEYLGVSYNTFQKLRYNGLKLFEVDGVKRVYKNDLDEFIKKIVFKEKNTMARKKNKAIKQYKLKNGETRYMFKVYQGMDPKTGNRRETTRRSFLNYREAEIEYGKLKVNGQKGNFINQITYRVVYEDWFKFYKKQGNRASTIQKTEQFFKHHILPQLGHIKIQKIDYKICLEAAYVWYEALKYSKKIEQYAKLVLEHAVNLKYMDRNPMQSVSTPVKNHDVRQVSFYTREELIEFLEAAKKEPLKNTLICV